MALRDVAGGAARMSAGFWTEVAKAINPTSTPPSERPGPVETPAEQPPIARTSETNEPPAPDAPPPAPDAPPPAANGVLVPVETWTRVLDQLGHLHEAGRELAEARERAARAETQVEFLKEQLTEAKTAKRKPAARRPAASAAAKPPAASNPPEAPPTDVIDLRTGARTRVTNARNRVGRWISSTS